MHSLIVDRKESGAPGDFAALTTEAEVLDVVRKELGDRVADALVASLAAEPTLKSRGRGEAWARSTR